MECSSRHRGARSAALVVALALSACASSGGASPGGDGAREGDAAGRPATAPSAAEYRVYVANESSDIISRVVFRPGAGGGAGADGAGGRIETSPEAGGPVAAGAGDRGVEPDAPTPAIEVESEIPVGIMLADSDGAHGLVVSPDGEHFYVTLAHGVPYGYLWKFHAGPDTLAGRATLGQFPASVGTTPDGNFVIVGNFNLHGDMVPSDVSFVYAPSMTEVSRITTCLMPHGSRVNEAGTRHYSTCMHSDQVVEIDLTTFRISGRFSVSPAGEGALALDDRGEHGPAAAHGAGSADGAGTDRARGGGMDHPEHAEHRDGAPAAATDPDAAVCSPTWVEPGKGARANRFVYIACNRTDEVLEVDVDAWRVTRRFATGAGPYNLNTTADGRWVVATLKGGQGVSLLDLEAGEEAARLATSEPITHGVTSSPDSRYAFVSNEAIGATRGTLDVFDLEQRERVASVTLRHQPAGIDFWRMTPP